MPERRRRLHLAVLVLLVLAGAWLRLRTAQTAVLHDDELHVTADARWLESGIDAGTAIAYLRHHAADHRILNPVTHAFLPQAKSRVPRSGHPTLFAWLAGPIVALVHIEWPRDAVDAVRRIVVVVSALQIPAVAWLLAGMGAGTAAQLLAAAGIALLPAAATYGGLAMTEPLQGLLLLLSLGAAVRAGRGTRWAAAAGLAAGLALATDVWAVITLPAVALLVARSATARGRALAACAGTAFAALVVVVDPLDWTAALLAPLEPFRRLQFAPLDTLRQTLGYLAEPLTWYWLGIQRHGRPLAFELAWWHGLVTPAWLTLLVLSALRALVRRDGTVLSAVVLPLVLVLCFTPPSDGLFRLPLLFPLSAALIADALATARWTGRLLLLGAGVLAVVASYAVDPMHDGRLDMARLLFVNAGVVDPVPQPGLTGVEQPNMTIPQQVTIRRRLLVPPGRWRYWIDGLGWMIFDLDGHQLVKPTLTNRTPPFGEITLEGWVHDLSVESKLGATTLRGFVLWPADAPIPPGVPPHDLALVRPAGEPTAASSTSTTTSATRSTSTTALPDGQPENPGVR